MENYSFVIGFWRWHVETSLFKILYFARIKQAWSAIEWTLKNNVVVLDTSLGALI